MELIRLKPSGERDVRGLSGRVAVRWPDRMRLLVRDSRGAMVGQAVADGRALWTVGAGEGGRPRYRQEPLAEGMTAAAFTRGGLVGPEFADVITGKDPVERFRAQGAKVSPVEPRVVAGVTVEGVVVSLAGPGAGGDGGQSVQGGASRVVTMWFAAGSRQLVQVVDEQRTADGERVRRTETHSEIRVGQALPDSLFAFRPPAGATPVSPRVTSTGPLVSSLPGNAPAVQRRNQFQVSNGTEPVPSGVTPVFRTANASNATASAVTYPLAIVPLAASGAGKAVAAPEPGLGVARLGEVAPSGVAAVEQAFVLKNVSTRAVTLAKIADSARELTVTLKDADGASGPDALKARPERPLPARLEPGKTIAVFVRLDLAEHPAGPLAKTAHVYADDEPNRPIARLQLTGNIKPLVTFAPAQLVFPPLSLAEAPAAKPQTLVATIDPGLWERSQKAGLERPELLSGDPRLHITLDPDPTGLRENQVRYRVSLKPEGMAGPVQVTPTLIPRASDNRRVDPTLTRAYRIATPAQILGDITGAVKASPPAILFPPPDIAGRPITVTLTGKPGALTGAEVQAESNSFSARLTVTPDGGTATLEVTLVPGKNLTDGRIAIRLPESRQVLLIPVAAFHPQ